MTHAKTCIRVGLVVFVALMMTTLPREASGQLTAEQKNQARTHFKAGQAFLQMERYAEAIDEFNKAYEITQDKLVMGQVAAAYEKAGDYEAALKAMELYREALPPDERASADGFIKRYKQAIADGKSKKLTLPSEKKPVAPVKTEEAEERTKPPAEEPDEEPGKSKRFYTWIAAGAAGALALSALVVGLNAQSKYDELSDTCKPNCPQSDVDSVETRALVTDILWGTAAAAAVTAGVLYFLEGRKLKGEERSTPVEGEEEDEEVMNRVRVTPVVGGGTFGVGANIRF